MQLPKIKENLLVQDLNGEVLIYDTTTNKSYCLNSTARTVFNACDGKKTFADLSLSEDIVYLSLDELKKHNLIESNYASPFVGMNRREVIRKVGLASMAALPVISALLVPSAANAASQTCARPDSINCICPLGTSAGTTCGQGIDYTTSSGIVYTPCDTGCTCRSAGCGSLGCGGRCE